jgi:hypothetical protein
MRQFSSRTSLKNPAPTQSCIQAAGTTLSDACAPSGFNHSQPLRAGHNFADMAVLAPAQSAAGLQSGTARSGEALQCQLDGERERPAPLSLPEKYKNEDKEVGWRAYFGKTDEEIEADRERYDKRARDTDIRTQHYTDDDRRKGVLATMDGNQLNPKARANYVNRHGQSPDGEKFLTSEATRKGGRVSTFDKKLYAMSPEGRVVTQSTANQIKDDTGTTKAHHSSIFAGGDVAHAGHIAVESGKLSYLDDDSGHYRPTAAHTFDAFSRFKEQGVLGKDNYQQGNISLVDKNKKKGEDGDYKANTLSLPFSSYEQTQGNEQQARNKKENLEQLKSKINPIKPSVESVEAAPVAPAQEVPAQVVLPEPVPLPAPVEVSSLHNYQSVQNGQIVPEAATAPKSNYGYVDAAENAPQEASPQHNYDMIPNAEAAASEQSNYGYVDAAENAPAELASEKSNYGYVDAAENAAPVAEAAPEEDPYGYVAA